MRFHTSITASRKAWAHVSINRRPSAAAPDEIEVEFGGLKVWLEIEEARRLSEDLWNAANDAKPATREPRYKPLDM